MPRLTSTLVAANTPYEADKIWQDMPTPFVTVAAWVMGPYVIELNRIFGNQGIPGLQQAVNP